MDEVVKKPNSLEIAEVEESLLKNSPSESNLSVLVNERVVEIGKDLVHDKFYRVTMRCADELEYAK